MEDRYTKRLDVLAEEISAIRTDLASMSKALLQELGLLRELVIDHGHHEDDADGVESVDLSIDPALDPIPEREAVHHSDPESVSALSDILDWLSSRGIRVRNSHDKGINDAVFSGLAITLGSRFSTLSRVHDVIRRSIAISNSFSLDLSSASQEEIAHTTQFCSELHAYAFLSRYNYNKRTRTIYATPQRYGPVINFFNGGWFEQYVYSQTTELLSQNCDGLSSLANPQIVLANGDDFELDLLFYCDDQPLWLECKTGDYSEYMVKYSEMSNTLGIPKQRSILVVLGLGTDRARQLTNLYGLTVTNEQTFLESISCALGVEVKSDATDLPVSQPTPSFGGHSELQTILNKAGIRPVPAYRHAIIAEILERMKQPAEPTTLKELKSHLALAVGTSKNQVSDVLRTLGGNDGLFLNEQGSSVISGIESITALSTYDPDELERICIARYVSAVLAQNAAFFENKDRVREFEHVIGGKLTESPLP